MDFIPLTPTDAVPLALSPTDISQFIRLEQCERYLRLRLYERNANRRFMQEYGVIPQSIPPLLTRSGASFEDATEAAATALFPTVDCGASGIPGGRPDNDNDRVLTTARTLAPGATMILFQPRLQVIVDGWRIRGDIDILRLERTADGELAVLIADMKSSTSAKVEHRLQVAFYQTMLATLFAAADIAASITLGILYRGPDEAHAAAHNVDATTLGEQHVAARQLLGATTGFLELVADAASYLGAVADLVTGPDSTARRVVASRFEAVPFHLTYKCDGCLYNEFCMKWSAEHDDLSLIPHLTANDKNALQRAGVTTVRTLATLKELPPDATTLVPTPDTVALARQLAATWPVGPRLDELIHRARRYRAWKKDPLSALPFIPSKGYGSLPYSDPAHNPNLVRVYIDAQHDYLEDRIYLLGARVVGATAGVPQPAQQRTVVHLTTGHPTADSERDLFVRWIGETLAAIVDVAAPDTNGTRRAPIHLIFFNSFEQRLLLDGLARHFATVTAATPLYDFMTQLAAFDSPLVTFLDREIRELKNYPMVCQSLQQVAAYLRFDWNAPEPFRDLFRTRLFDFWGKFDGPARAEPELSPWYTSRARFNSQIPLEYAYAAWDELPEGRPTMHDEFAVYQHVTPEVLRAFQARRLEALEYIAGDFSGNKQTEKRPFDLPDLTAFSDRAQDLAQALDEFVTIERHVTLGAWKTARLAPPERRVLAGETLIVRYDAADQVPEAAALNTENERRRIAGEAYAAAYRAAHPNAKNVSWPKGPANTFKWSQDGLELKLRLALDDVDSDADHVLGLTTLRVGDRVVVMPRTTMDERLPPAERTPFTPTPRQLLYGSRAEIVALEREPDAAGQTVGAKVTVRLIQRPGGTDKRGFTFAGIARPLLDGMVYTLDPDPNDVYGQWCAKVTEGLRAGNANTLYERLADPASARITWPADAVTGQARFLAGLVALDAAKIFHPFEDGKQNFIGTHGAASTLMVQGPPGTGKSYSTAFALFARLQGALTAGLPFRAFVACKTHAATDVLLANIVAVQTKLRALHANAPAVFDAHIDARLLDVPLFRAHGKKDPPDGVRVLRKKHARDAGERANVADIADEAWCIVAATPGGIYGMQTEAASLFTRGLCDCLVLDEASQMNLPEAIMAALPLKADGQLIVVGDHRQMPPIIKHTWGDEPRRTFQAYPAYQSLFETLRQQTLPTIRFAESFRLHAAMAAFLRDEIYYLDSIPYFSARTDVLDHVTHADPFVDSVLRPEHPLVVVVHDEAGSQLENAYEQQLLAPILAALSAADGHNLDAQTGLGVVVPHRAQRAALQTLVSRQLGDGAALEGSGAAVDTVERFQGGEREVILISATESDRDYLLSAGEFLLDPRRLTVALSRAKQKLVLVASRSVFSLFSADETTFTHAQLWKNLLRRTCTEQLWAGELAGQRVEVWGNPPG